MPGSACRQGGKNRRRAEVWPGSGAALLLQVHPGGPPTPKQAHLLLTSSQTLKDFAPTDSHGRRRTPAPAAEGSRERRDPRPCTASPPFPPLEESARPAGQRR